MITIIIPPLSNGMLGYKTFCCNSMAMVIQLVVFYNVIKAYRSDAENFDTNKL